MKATIHKLDNDFFALLPIEGDSSFGKIQPSVDTIKKLGIPIYKPRKIKVRLHENKIISGELKVVRKKTYFKFQEDLGEVEDYIKGILIGRSFTRISIERYNNIQKLASEQGKVTYNMVNGFAINRYYVCYGHIKEGKISNPFYLKIKDSVFLNSQT